MDVLSNTSMWLLSTSSFVICKTTFCYAASFSIFRICAIMKPNFPTSLKHFEIGRTENSAYHKISGESVFLPFPSMYGA